MRGRIATHTRLLHDFNRDLFAGALGNGFHNGPDFFRNPSLAADDLSHVAFGNTKLQNCPFLAGN